VANSVEYIRSPPANRKLGFPPVFINTVDLHRQHESYQEILPILNILAFMLFEGVGLLVILVHTVHIYETRKHDGSNTSLVRFLVHRGVFRFAFIFLWNVINLAIEKRIPSIYINVAGPLQNAFSSIILCRFYMDLNSLQDRLHIVESERVITTQIDDLPILEKSRPRPRLDGDFDDYVGDDVESNWSDDDDQVERRDDIESKLSDMEDDRQ